MEQHQKVCLHFGCYCYWQVQDHSLGVVVKIHNKQYIVLVLTPELPLTMQTPSDINNLKDKKGGDLQILTPKSKRGLEDDYYYSGTSRRGSGVVNIKLPYRGTAAATNYEVRGIDNKEFLLICNCKIKIDPVGLLEDVNVGAYSSTVQQLLVLKSDGNKYPPPLDPVKGLFLNLVTLCSPLVNCIYLVPFSCHL